MKFKNLAYAACLITACITTGALQAEPFGIEVDLTNGYRQDKLACLINTFDPAGTFIGSDNLTAHNMSIYQLGLKARYEQCGILVRADGDYGWGNDGHYHETFHDAVTQTITDTTAKLHHVNVQDGTVGAGYLFNLNDCGCGMYGINLDGVAIGPVAGWSYARQQFKLKNTFTNGVFDPVVNGVKYTERWQGPWLGVDATGAFCNYVLRTGYEYHWATWHATWTLPGPDTIGAFSDRRHANDAWGQVAYLDGRWYFCSGWNVGFGAKFQFWKARTAMKDQLLAALKPSA